MTAHRGTRTALALTVLAAGAAAPFRAPNTPAAPRFEKDVVTVRCPECHRSVTPAMRCFSVPFLICSAFGLSLGAGGAGVAKVMPLDASYLRDHAQTRGFML